MAVCFFPCILGGSEVVADWCRGCSTSNDEWCVATSTYHTCMLRFSSGGDDRANRDIAGQVQQPYVPVPKHSEIDFESM